MYNSPQYVDDSFLYDTYWEGVREIPPATHVLYFEKGKHPKTHKEQWQARRKEDSSVTVYVPVDGGIQPENRNEVWLCTEGETIVNCPEKNFRVVSVHLYQKIINKGEEFSVHFVLDRTRLVGEGKHPWNHRLGIVTYTPDGFGSLQPSEGHEFWICRFYRVAFVNTNGRFVLVAVELLREDFEAQRVYLDKVAHEEKCRLEQARLEELRVKQVREDLERRHVVWLEEHRLAEAQKRAREQFEQTDPALAERLRRLDKMEKLIQDPPSVAVSRPQYTGGGCGTLARPKRRKAGLHSSFSY